MEETPAGFAEDPNVRRGVRSGADWRSDSAAKPAKGKLAAITLILIFIIAGVILAMFFWTGDRTEPRAVSLPVYQYGSDWAVNPWADQDAARLMELFGGLGSKTVSYQQADKFREWLEWLSAKPDRTPPDLPADLKSRPLVLHITAHAAVRPEGVCMMVPGRHKNRDTLGVEWIRVDELLDAIRQCPATKKILFLDLAHPISDPFNGVLDDMAATALDDLLNTQEKNGSLPCAVLTSCGPRQLSLPCDAERASAFGFYLTEGLQGAADGVLPGDDANDEVTAEEIVRFTMSRVDRWAWQCFARHQNPMLHVVDEKSLNFIVAHRRAFPEDRYNPPAALTYLKDLREAWAERDLYPRRDDPLGYARLTAGLLRAEEIWNRTGLADRAKNEWDDAKRAMQADGSASRSQRTLAEWEKTGNAPAVEFRLPTTTKLEAKTMEELTTLLREFVNADPKADADPKLKWRLKSEQMPEEAARLVWQMAGKETLERKTLDRYLAALSVLVLPKTCAEVVLLEKLRYDFTDKPQDLVRQPKEAVLELMRGEAVVTQIATASSAGFSILSKRFAEAEAIRLEGERMLYSATNASIDDARAKLMEGTEKLASVLKLLQDRQHAWKVANEARDVVLETMPASITYNSPSFDEWKLAVSETQQLVEKLEKPTEISDGSEWVILKQSLLKRIINLQAPWDREAIKNVKKSPPRTKSDEVASLQKWLAGSALTGTARADVWDTWMSDARTLHKEKARKQDEADDSTNSRIPRPATTNEPTSRDQPRRRAEASISLLMLAGFACDKTLLDVANAKNDEDWIALGTALRKCWLTAAKGNLSERAMRSIPADAVRDFPMNTSRPWLVAAEADANAQKRWTLEQLMGTKAYRSGSPAAEKFYNAISIQLPKKHGDMK